MTTPTLPAKKPRMDSAERERKRYHCNFPCQVFNFHHMVLSDPLSETQHMEQPGPSANQDLPPSRDVEACELCISSLSAYDDLVCMQYMCLMIRPLVNF